MWYTKHGVLLSFKKEGNSNVTKLMNFEDIMLIGSQSQKDKHPTRHKTVPTTVNHLSQISVVPRLGKPAQ